MNKEKPIAAAMRTKLEAAFSPASLSIVDESARHAGHMGARPEGETHFNVRIVSSAFTGLNRVDRQRKIYSCVAQELKERVHALSVTALTPEEDKR